MKPETKRSSPANEGSRITANATFWLLCAIGFPLFPALQFGTLEGQARSGLQVRSSSFSDGGQVPTRYTCDGGNVSPNLQWLPAPARTKSFAIVVDDPDAPVDFTHWLVFNIPSGIRSIPEGASTRAGMPNGAAEGTNGFGRMGYSGPCPPRGKPHRYVFHLYALDIPLDLPAGTARTQLDSAMHHHVVAEGQVTGMYGRSIE